MHTPTTRQQNRLFCTATTRQQNRTLPCAFSCLKTPFSYQLHQPLDGVLFFFVWGRVCLLSSRWIYLKNQFLGEISSQYRGRGGSKDYFNSTIKLLLLCCKYLKFPTAMKNEIKSLKPHDDINCFKICLSHEKKFFYPYRDSIMSRGPYRSSNLRRYHHDKLSCVAMIPSCM